MSVDDANIRSTTQMIWSSVLGLELRALEEIPAEDGELASTACILISGDWEGAVMLLSKTEAARGFVAKMFESAPEDLSDGDFDDGLGELANLVGGNFKNQVGGTCALSLPTVVHGREHTLRVPQSHLRDQAAFEVDGARLVVRVLERDGAGTALELKISASSDVARPQDEQGSSKSRGAPALTPHPPSAPLQRKVETPMPITVNETDLFKITENIWSSLFGLTIELLPEVPPESTTESCVTACVLISGGWEGAVIVQCASPLARRSAALMFDSTPETIASDEVNDAMGELVNMVGGNFKTLIPGTCSLSLPAVVEGRDYSVKVPGSQPIKRVAFHSDGGVLTVSVLERVEGGRGTHPPHPAA
jgi:chemotaxis protein CheX